MFLYEKCKSHKSWEDMREIWGWKWSKCCNLRFGTWRSRIGATKVAVSSVAYSGIMRNPLKLKVKKPICHNIVVRAVVVRAPRSSNVRWLRRNYGNSREYIQSVSNRSRWGWSAQGWLRQKALFGGTSGHESYVTMMSLQSRDSYNSTTYSTKIMKEWEPH